MRGEDDQGCSGDRGDSSGIEGDVSQYLEVRQENELLKNSPLLRQGTIVAERYELINRKEDSYPIASMFRRSRVSKSSYYSPRPTPVTDGHQEGRCGCDDQGHF